MFLELAFDDDIVSEEHAAYSESGVLDEAIGSDDALTSDA